MRAGTDMQSIYLRSLVAGFGIVLFVAIELFVAHSAGNVQAQPVAADAVADDVP
jgi:hypothetical protein